jgi:hypothetical protein
MRCLISDTSDADSWVANGPTTTGCAAHPHSNNAAAKMQVRITDFLAAVV